MWYSGKRKVYLVLLLIMLFSVLEIWVFSSEHCSIRSISTSTPPLPPDSDAVKPSELHRKFFNGRFADLNITSTDDDKRFQQNKRIIPSCPDPLHN
ncbi:hypothetical protein L6452_18142 [Arctium lappa]|uniref:Uncharacterized protein n=1 Tax=Arctium lappa TaxID=4217 RepID=A0ACB9C582_ARCLA|nr:hypothetical protein L6452_18142 [Arctium lappa]